jgi:hypothetical protein
MNVATRTVVTGTKASANLAHAHLAPQVFTGLKLRSIPSAWHALLGNTQTKKAARAAKLARKVSGAIRPLTSIRIVYHAHKASTRSRTSTMNANFARLASTCPMEEPSANHALLACGRATWQV